MGGISSEREVSLNSGKSVLSAINRDKYDVHELIIDEPMDVVNKMPEGVDFALLILHGKYGEDGTIQAMLESMGIKYSGCDPLTSGICMDKNMSKKVLKASNIPTAPWTIAKSLDSIDYDAIEKMGYPVFIKPNSGGSSVATFKVDRKEDVYEAVRQGLEVDDIVMIEGYLPGDEYTSFILNGEVFPTIKISSPNEFFDYEAKYTASRVEEITPARISDALTREIQELTARIYDSIGCKGIIRADYIIVDGTPYLLEVNTTPGMTVTSFIPQQVRAAGLDMKSVLTELIETELSHR